MSHMTFIFAAYALTILGTVGLAGWSFVAMRRAEAEAETSRRDR